MVSLIDVMCDMYKSGECDKVINSVHKRFFEKRKAKHDKKLIGSVVELCKNGSKVSRILVIHEMQSVEMVKDLYCLYEMEISKEQKND